MTEEQRAALIEAGWTPPPEPVDPLLLMARDITDYHFTRRVQKVLSTDVSVTQFALAKLREAQALVKRQDVEKVKKAIKDAYITGSGCLGVTDAAIKAIQEG